MSRFRQAAIGSALAGVTLPVDATCGDAAEIRARIAAAIQPLPDPLRSDREAERAAHADLGELSEVDLWRERERCRMRLALDDSADPWVTERLARVREEERRRAESR
jgi:hypothetical protein